MEGGGFPDKLVVLHQRSYSPLVNWNGQPYDRCFLYALPEKPNAVRQTWVVVKNVTSSEPAAH